MKKLIILMLVISCNKPYISESGGKSIYLQQCAKCHNVNPNNVGSLGPDLVSTPKDAFKSKVIHGTYPEGYTPKRKSKVMPKFPQYDDDIESIYKYIQSFKK